MTRNRWTFSIVLLNAFICINAEIEKYLQQNLQNGGLPEIVMLPQDCFEVCNDYECLYLCPQPSRGVKRCATPLKSTKKNCCKNGEIENTSETDTLKTTGKHIWQAKEQLLGIRKGIENDLANRRYSLLKGLQPLSLRQHNRDLLNKLGGKTSKPKCNTTPTICRNNDKQFVTTTNAPNNCVNTKQAVPGTGTDENTADQVPLTLPLYNKDFSSENESGRTSDDVDEQAETPFTTTLNPSLANENLEKIREQVNAPHSELLMGENEKVQNNLMDGSGDTRILEAENVGYDTDPSMSHNFGCNGPHIDQSNDETFVHQPIPFLNSNGDQTNNYNEEVPITNGDEIGTMGPNIFQPVPVIYYVDPYRGGPMEIVNNVLPETNQDVFQYKAPFIETNTLSDIAEQSKLQTEETIKPMNTEEMHDIVLTELHNPIPMTPESIGEKHSKVSEDISGEPGDKPISNDSKNYTYSENEKSFSINNDKKTPSYGSDRVMAGTSVGSKDADKKSLNPNANIKTDFNVLISNKTDDRNEANRLQTNENSPNVVKVGMDGFSYKLNDTQHVDDQSSSNVKDISETNREISAINLSLEREGVETDDKDIEVNKSENSLYVKNFEKGDSSEKLIDTHYKDYYLNNNPSSKGNEESKANGRISGITLSSKDEGFQSDDIKIELNNSENNFYVEKDNEEDSKQKDTRYKDNYQRGNSSSTASEKSEGNGRISSINLHSESGVQANNKNSDLNNNENNLYVVNDEIEGFSENLKDISHGNNYLKDNSSSTANEKSETNGRISEINLTSERAGFQADDKNADLNKSENNFYDELEGSSDERLSYDYMNDNASSYVNEKSESNRLIPESSHKERDGFHINDKKSLLDILKLSASAGNQKQNYTYRILQDLISRYNISSDLGGGTKATEFFPMNSTLEHDTSKHNFTQEHSVTTSDPSSESTHVLKNKSKKNETTPVVDNMTVRNKFSSEAVNHGTNIELSNNEKTEESTHNRQVFRNPNNMSIIDIPNSKNIPLKSSSDILNSLKLDGVLRETDGITYPNENTTHDSPEILNATFVTDNKNFYNVYNLSKTSLKTATDRGNEALTKSPYSSVPGSDQDTVATNVYLDQKELFNNDSHTNPYHFENYKFQAMRNGENEVPKYKKKNPAENQFSVESNIEEPILENSFETENEYLNKLKYPEIVDQQLIYDEEASESPNIHTTNDVNAESISINGSIDEKRINETGEYKLYEEPETLLHEIPNVSEIPSSNALDDERTQIKNRGIEEFPLNLQENNETCSYAKEENDMKFYAAKNQDDLSTELNDSPTYTLEDKIHDSTIDKTKLSDVINTELNSFKQQNIVLKKREEEEMYREDSQCDCDYSISREEDERSLRAPMDRASFYPHQGYPMFIIVPVPYPVCSCGNKTNSNNLDNKNISPNDPYLSRKQSDPLPGFLYNSNYNFQYARERGAPRTPLYIPDILFSFLPWRGMHSIVNSYHQLVDQQNKNPLQSRDSMTERDAKFVTTTKNNLSKKRLRNYNPGDIEEIHEETVPESQRFSRNGLRDTGITEYEFVDGQYVKVLNTGSARNSADMKGREETHATIIEEPTAESSTTPQYAYTTEEPSPTDRVPNSAVLETQENDESPTYYYYYPGDLGELENPQYSYYPGYFYTLRR